MSTHIVKVHSFKDSSFQKDQFSKYHLSILIRRNAFAFTVLDSSLNKYVQFETLKPEIPAEKCFSNFALKEIADHIGNQLKALDFSKKAFSSVKVIYESYTSTLVPIELYEKGKEKVYLDFVHDPYTETENKYHSNYIKIIDSYNIFPVPVQFINILNKHFKEYKIYSQAESLISSLLKHYNTNTENVLFFNARFREFDLLLMGNGSLKYFNSFSFNEADDILYYILNFVKQNKLNPEKLNLVLIDEIYDDSDIYKKLSDYFRNIEFIKRNPEFHYSPVFDNLPEHTYYSLFSLNKCE